MPAPFISVRRRATQAVRALVGQAMSYRIAAGDIRREAWALGGRHLGQVIIGARLESRLSGLSVHRAALLKAVIRSEASKAGPFGVKGPKA